LPASDQGLLEQLFLAATDDAYAALLPADDHPGRRLRSWQSFYELEGDAALTYASRFYADVEYQPVEGFPALSPEDALVIIGSQVANHWARLLLGRADGVQPVFQISHAGWHTELHWNLHTPESAPTITVADFKGPRVSVAHVIAERGTQTCYQSERDPTGIGYLDDYLLVTVLPRQRDSQQRATIFSGLHGPGSRAVDLILREPPTDLLQEAVHQTAGAAYFQMLMHFETTAGAQGEGFPCHPELVEARPLLVESVS
jgi:hypothetical protein